MRSRNSYRTRSCPSSCAKPSITASRHRCGTSRWCHTSLIAWGNSRSTVGLWFTPSLRSSTGSSSGPTAFAFAIDLKAPVNLFSVGSTPRACVIGHWGLGEPFEDVESELIVFRVEKDAEEPRPPSEDKPWVSQHYALLVTDVLRANLPRVLYVQGLGSAGRAPSDRVGANPPLYPGQEPFVGIVTDPVNARIFSPDSSLQLTVLGVSPLSLPGCLSRGRRHADLCFCLGVSPPSQPRPPGRSWRRNPFCSLQCGCRKGSLHIINTAAAWGKCPEVVSDHCRGGLSSVVAGR